MPTDRKIPFYRPYFAEQTRAAIVADISEILGNGQLMLGPWKDKLETAYSTMCGVKHAVSVNSATTALQISLEYFGVRGAEVLVPAASFVTDLSAVIFAGGVPVLVDANPNTLSFDLADLERKLSPRTKVIIWVHLTGVIAPDYREVQAFAKKRGLFLLEDAAHAHGAAIDGKMAGSLGDVGVFSFYPTKVVTSGTGGLLTTNDDGLKDFAERMRLFGKSAITGDIVNLGNDWFLDEIRACVAWHHTQALADQLAWRRAVAARYNANFVNQPNLTMLQLANGHEPAWYHYTIMLTDKVDHAAVTKALKDDYGIHTKIYRPVHHEPVFREYDDGTLKSAEHLLDRSLCLPMYVGLLESDVDYVSNAVIETLRAI